MVYHGGVVSFLLELWSRKQQKASSPIDDKTRGTVLPPTPAKSWKPRLNAVGKRAVWWWTHGEKHGDVSELLQASYPWTSSSLLLFGTQYWLILLINHLLSKDFHQCHTTLALDIQANTSSRWWFQIFDFHPDPWGNDPIWRAYVSDGLRTPTIVIRFCALDPFSGVLLSYQTSVFSCVEGLILNTIFACPLVPAKNTPEKKRLKFSWKPNNEMKSWTK